VQGVFPDGEDFRNNEKVKLEFNIIM
jgi:hypothetical protein